MENRTLCLRCRRPESVCVCGAVVPVESRTQILFLQHPRESRMPVSTCRLAHLSLPNSRMFVGIRPEGMAGLEELIREPGTMVLFPGPGSKDAESLAEPPPRLVVVDGSWIDARKLVERSPLLSSLPRIGFVPAQPTNYRIRKEPAEHCVSTIEAVVHILEKMENAPGKFRPILGCFTRMVDKQLEYIGKGPRRHAPRPSPVEGLRQQAPRLVFLFAEGGGQGDPNASSLIHWVARRYSTDEHFESIAHPERPLAEYAPLDLGLPRIPRGEDLAQAVRRWQAFLRPDDVLATWGRYPFEELRGQDVEIPELLDLKRLISNVMKAPLGGVEVLASRLGAELPEGRGRPSRKLVALHAVVEALLDGRLKPG